MTRNSEQLTVPPDGRPVEEQPKWRQDFPIDWPQDHYISRRDFTKFMVLTSLAFAVGQIWIGARNVLRRRRGAATITQVATVDQVPVGGSFAFNYPEAHDSCLLLRPGENRFLAFSQKCTHLSCAVVPQADKGRLYCPCHEGAFDFYTGTPIAGPPRRPLPPIALEIHGNAIYATGVGIRTV